MAARGDGLKAEELFEILVSENSDMLWAYLRSAVFDRQAGEDIYQETLVVAWRRLADYDRDRPFGAWLRGIAGKLVLAYIRKHGRRSVALCDDAALEALAEKFGESEEASPANTWDERFDALNDCIGRLADQDREIVHQHYQKDHDCKSISGHVGLSVEAVKKRLQRARAALMRCIEDKIGAPTGE